MKRYKRISFLFMRIKKTAQSLLYAASFALFTTIFEQDDTFR